MHFVSNQSIDVYKDSPGKETLLLPLLNSQAFRVKHIHVNAYLLVCVSVACTVIITFRFSPTRDHGQMMRTVKIKVGTMLKENTMMASSILAKMF